MDFNDIKAELVHDRDFTYQVPAEFSWDNHLEKTAGHASTDPHLFGHVQYGKQTVLERVCPAGRLIFVNQSENGIRLARIETACIDQLFVEYLNGSSGDRDWVTVADVVTDTEEYYAAFQGIPEKYRSCEFYDREELVKYIDILNVPLESLVKKNQFFEVQDRSDPQNVFIAKVAECFGGIVVYECVHVEKKILITHIADSLCHALGWAESCVQKASYHEVYRDYTLPDDVEPVPAIVFERNPVKPHNMKVGLLLEVQDAGVGTAFFPGHVSQIINDHYFKITTSSSSSEKPVQTRQLLQTVAHSSSPYLHPVNFCSSNRLIMYPPSSLSHMMNGKTAIWDLYKAHCVEETATTENSTDSHFHSTAHKGRVACMRYVEVFCYNQGIMFSGLIVRSFRGTVWVLPGHETDPSAVIVLKCGSLEFFPCGYAKKYRVPVIGESPFSTLKKLDEDDRFNMRRYYRAVPSAVFRKFNYSGRGRPEKKWAFMSDIWLKGDRWLPNVYINRKCYVGVWFDRHLFSTLSDHYPAGPLPQIIKLIIKDLYRCASSLHRGDVQSVLSSDDNVPVMAVKYRWRAEHILLKVPCCESADQFSGWLKTILRCVGCCPNLFTLRNDINCELSCFEMENNDYDKFPSVFAPLESSEVQDNTSASSGRSALPSTRSAINSRSSEEVVPRPRRSTTKVAGGGTSSSSSGEPSPSFASENNEQQPRQRHTKSSTAETASTARRVPTRQKAGADMTVPGYTGNQAEMNTTGDAPHNNWSSYPTALPGEHSVPELRRCLENPLAVSPSPPASSSSGIAEMARPSTSQGLLSSSTALPRLPSKGLLSSFSAQPRPISKNPASQGSSHGEDYT